MRRPRRVLIARCPLSTVTRQRHPSIFGSTAQRSRSNMGKPVAASIGASSGTTAPGWPVARQRAPGPVLPDEANGVSTPSRSRWMQVTSSRDAASLASSTPGSTRRRGHEGVRTARFYR